MFSKGGKRVIKKCGCSSEIEPIHFYLVIYHFYLMLLHYFSCAWFLDSMQIRSCYNNMMIHIMLATICWDIFFYPDDLDIFLVGISVYFQIDCAISSLQWFALEYLCSRYSHCVAQPEISKHTKFSTFLADLGQETKIWAHSIGLSQPQTCTQVVLHLILSFRIQLIN